MNSYTPIKLKDLVLHDNGIAWPSPGQQSVFGYFVPAA